MSYERGSSLFPSTTPSHHTMWTQPLWVNEYLVSWCKCIQVLCFPVIVNLQLVKPLLQVMLVLVSARGVRQEHLSQCSLGVASVCGGSIVIALGLWPFPGWGCSGVRGLQAMHPRPWQLLFSKFSSQFSPCSLRVRSIVGGMGLWLYAETSTMLKRS